MVLADGEKLSDADHFELGWTFSDRLRVFSCRGPLRWHPTALAVEINEGPGFSDTALLWF